METGFARGADVSYEKPYWIAKMTYMRSADVNMSDLATEANKGTVWNTGRYTKKNVKTFLWDPELYEKAGEYATERSKVPIYNPNNQTDNPGLNS